MATPFSEIAATSITKAVVDAAAPSLRVVKQVSTAAQSSDSTAPGFVNKSFQAATGASLPNDVGSVTTLRPRLATQDAPFSAVGDAITPSSNEQPQTNDQDAFGYKVRLFAVRNFPNERVIFEVSPTVSEGRTVEYNAVNPIHMPGSIQVYKRTGSRTFSVGAKFISRNVSQASMNMQYLQQLRGWTMPYFGLRSHYDVDTTAADARYDSAKKISDAGSMLGAPPDVLYFYAYSSGAGSGGDRAGAFQTNLKKIPVVITGLNFDYPDDVDYIPTANGDPFPVKMDVRIELAETHSPKGYEEFSLSMFKQGRLVQF